MLDPWMLGEILKNLTFVLCSGDQELALTLEYTRICSAPWAVASIGIKLMFFSVFRNAVPFFVGEDFLFPATLLPWSYHASWGWTELKTDAGFSWFFCCMMHTDTGKKGKWGECEMRCTKTGCQLFTQKCRERKRSWKPKMWKMAHTAFLFCSWWPHYCGWRWKCPNRAFILPHTPCSPLMEHTCCKKVQLLTLCS